MKVKFDVDRFEDSILVVLTVHEATNVATGAVVTIEELQGQLAYAIRQMAEQLGYREPDAAQRGIEARKGADNG